uniref:DUF19 domain-containing protein n=1 Tax=Caenorhabditis tropicalis TaxID=1561998 RepID=A0A1I7UJB1_9PELO
MRAIFNLLLLSGIVLAFDKTKCSPADQQKVTECLEKHKELGDKAVEFDLTQPGNISKLNDHCEDLQSCGNIIRCGANETENIAKTISYCEVVSYHVSPEYLNCIKKLDSSTSKCTQDWNPLPELEEDAADYEEKRKEACDNFFGKDGCLGREITEICGLDTWKNFERNYLILKKVVGKCN